MKKIAVFFGGKSCEREISILTGVFVLNLLDREKYEPIPVYLHSDGNWYSSPEMFDVESFKKPKIESYNRLSLVGNELFTFSKKIKRQTTLKSFAKLDCGLNCCHGGLGEGGGVSALSALNDLPFASPPMTPSGVFLDKAFSKIVLNGLNIPTLDYMRVNEQDYAKRGQFLLKNIRYRLGYPVVVKPARLGSSIGITAAKSEDELKSALELAFSLDDKVIIEKFLEDKSDVNCAAYLLNGEIVVSEPEIAASGKDVYSFSDKYLQGGGLLRGKQGKSGGLDKETTHIIKAFTKTLYRKCDLFGVVRVDYLVKDKEVYLSEVNTVPGSLAYYLFCERLTDARAFFTDLIEEALTVARAPSKVLVETGILTTVRRGGKK